MYSAIRATHVFDKIGYGPDAWVTLYIPDLNAAYCRSECGTNHSLALPSGTIGAALGHVERRRPDQSPSIRTSIADRILAPNSSPETSKNSYVSQE